MGILSINCLIVSWCEMTKKTHFFDLWSQKIVSFWEEDIVESVNPSSETESHRWSEISESVEDEVIGRMNTTVFICLDINIERISNTRTRSSWKTWRLQCSHKRKKLRRKKLDSHDNIIPWWTNTPWWLNIEKLKIYWFSFAHLFNFATDKWKYTLCLLKNRYQTSSLHLVGERWSSLYTRIITNTLCTSATRWRTISSIIQLPNHVSCGWVGRVLEYCDQEELKKIVCSIQNDRQCGVGHLIFTYY